MHGMSYWHAAAIVAACGSTASAQIGFDTGASTGFIGGSVFANVNAVSDGPTMGASIDWFPGLFGGDTAGQVFARTATAIDNMTGCRVDSRLGGFYGVFGIGSDCVELRFSQQAKDNFRRQSDGQCPPCMFFADADGTPSVPGGIGFTAVFTYTGLTPTTIYYRIRAGAGAAGAHEAATEDPVTSVLTSLDLTTPSGGDSAVPLGLDNSGLAPGIGGARGGLRSATSGSFSVLPGETWTIDMSGGVSAIISDPGTGACPDGTRDGGAGTVEGIIEFSLRGPLPPVGSDETVPPEGFTVFDGLPTFSVDIGSDAELSDPFGPADPQLDPADIYMAFGPAFGAPGFDGFLDDFSLAGVNVTDPDPGGIPAPVCVGSAVPLGVVAEYIDIDATDSVDFDIRDFLPAGVFADAPIPAEALNSETLFPARNLLISYEDDGVPAYFTGPVCSVPPTSTDFAFEVYGSDTVMDEVLTLDLTFGPAAAGLGASEAGILSEEMLHGALSPSPSPLPFIGDTSDDDVDALDVEWDAGFAGFWYFSVDNEALGTFQAQNLTLDPGFIYLADPGGAIPVITPAQLGLPVGFGVDIDAFEFVRAVNPFITGGAQDPEQPPCDREETGGSLAVIFSVDRDDPSTPITSFDESGGLDPTRIYISFLDGTNIPLTAPLESDVDAVAAWFRSLAEEPFADCNGNGVNDIDEIFVDPGLDGNGNFILDLCEGIAGPCSGADLAPPFGIISQADVTAFVNAFFAMDPAADLAPPFGVISQADVTAFVNLFFAGCPAR